MSVITSPSTTAATTTATTSRSLLRTTVTVGVVAAVGTTAVAAALRAAGVPFEVDGAIPLMGFAQMTLLGAFIGGIIVAVLNRRSAVPRQRFLQVTGLLTALSCVPSVTLPPDAATKIALVATHLVAAAIIVPVLARHAHD